MQAASAKVRTLPPYQPTAAAWEAKLRELGIPLPGRPATDAQQRVSELRAVLRDLSQGWTAGAPAPEQESFTAYMRGLLRPEDGMRAGMFNAHAAVFEALFCEAGVDGAEELKEVLHGIRLRFCKPDHPQKQREPRHARKMRGTAISLREAGYSRKQHEAWCQAEQPGPVVLGNRLSSAEDLQFARETIAQWVKTQAVLAWPFAATRPHVVLSLAVATSASGKRRLILDARYTNLFLQYFRCHFESLRSAVPMLRGSRYAYVLDLKAGYHHLLVAREHWTFLGFELDGQLYVFSALPFGISQAPEAFTRLMERLYGILRQRRLALSFMIDDSCGAGADLARTCWQLACHVRFFTALGAVFGKSKGTWWPQPSVRFLGILVDLPRQAYCVPADKLERFEAALARLRQRWDHRAAIAAIGLLASFAPALQLTPLLTRALREAHASGSVDSVGPLGTVFLRFWGEHLKRLNGKPWASGGAVKLRLVSDASESAFGAFCKDAAWEASVPFTEVQKARMQNGEFSSTERELWGFLVALQGLMAARPGLICSGKAVQITSDSQAACHAAEKMRGNERTFPAVCALHLWAWLRRLELTFSWQPRTSEDMVYADWLSKYEDPTDWALSHNVVQQQIVDRLPAALRASLHPWDGDLFASSAACQPCSWYFATVWDSSCAAVDAMLWPWDRAPARHAAHASVQPRLFAFPPPHLVGEVLAKATADKVRLVLICPRRLPSLEAARLEALRVWSVDLHTRVAKRGAPDQRMHFVRPTARVPEAVRRSGWRTPLQAVVIDGRDV